MLVKIEWSENDHDFQVVTVCRECDNVVGAVIPFNVPGAVGSMLLAMKGPARAALERQPFAMEIPGAYLCENCGAS